MRYSIATLVVAVTLALGCQEDDGTVEPGDSAGTGDSEEVASDSTCRAAVTLIDRTNNQDSYYCGDLEDPSDCCPEGFSFAGYSAESTDAVICLEDGPGSTACRAVVRVLAAPGAKDQICGDFSNPISCCPDGFDLIGYPPINRDAVVCLEQEVGDHSRGVLEVIDLYDNQDHTKCADLPDPQDCCIEGFTFVGYSAVNVDSVVCLED